MKELIEHLQEQIQNIPPDEMDDSSWGYEEGVLISGNQAKQIVGILERLDGLDDEVINTSAQEESSKHSVPFQVITKEYLIKGMKDARDYIKGKQKQS